MKNNRAYLTTYETIGTLYIPFISGAYTYKGVDWVPGNTSLILKERLKKKIEIETSILSIFSKETRMVG